MPSHLPTLQLQPDINELILCVDERYSCETYIFEPTDNERPLGRLIAVAEVEHLDGVGSELRDMAISAIQREYYRQPSRGLLGSFEAALHQANLVLHDSAEQGVRDWMSYFHVAVGVLSDANLHISVAGEAIVLLNRRSHLTAVSYGLSHSPITNPLRTFSQVASGTVAARDTIFFATSHFPELYQETELTRLSLDHSASTIGLRLQQLYADRGARDPVAILTVSILPQHIVEPRREIAAPRNRRSVELPAASLLPRQPLLVRQSTTKRFLTGILGLMVGGIRLVYQRLAPLLRQGSIHSRQLILQASSVTSRGVKTLTQRQFSRWQKNVDPNADNRLELTPAPLASPRWRPSLATLTSLPGQLLALLRDSIRTLPLVGRVFALLTLVLTIAFASSLFLLKQKRTEDQAIVRASELLHEARTKHDAAGSALIYDNRDQARSLLSEAEALSEQLGATGLYADETNRLKADLAVQRDRLQKVVRLKSSTSKVIGDFSSVLGQETPRQLFVINETLFTFNPANNAVIKMEPDGTVAPVSEKTQGIGFFTVGTAHEPDKTITFLTDEPGVALFDSKTNTVQKQEITFSSGKPQLTALAPYGSRLYVYDEATNNIYSYSKTLRGYSGGEAWLKQAEPTAPLIVSFGIDGAIWALHRTGNISKFLKGEAMDFTTDPIDPPLEQPTRLITNETMRSLYILDRSTPRVLIFNKKGGLLRQIYLEDTPSVLDIAVSNDEKTLYALTGSRVVSVALDK